MPISVVGKIRGKDLINPKKAIAELKEGDYETEITAGVIHGVAAGVISRTMDNGDIAEGLVGKFEARRLDGSVIQSGRLFLPTSLQPYIHKAFAGEQKPEFIRFAVLMKVKQDTNPQAYTWVMQNLIEPTEDDPLEETRKLVTNALTGPASAPQIEHKKGKGRNA